jgi:hypothetical protein
MRRAKQWLMVAEPLFSPGLAVALMAFRRSRQVDRLDDERKRNHQDADHASIQNTSI